MSTITMIHFWGWGSQAPSLEPIDDTTPPIIIFDPARKIVINHDTGTVIYKKGLGPAERMAFMAFLAALDWDGAPTI